MMQFLILLVIVAIVSFMIGKIITDHKHDAELSRRDELLKQYDKKIENKIKNMGRND